MPSSTRVNLAPSRNYVLTPTAQAAHVAATSRDALARGLRQMRMGGLPDELKAAERCGYAAAGGRLLVCPICFNSKKLDSTALVANAELGGTQQLWEWIGRASCRERVLTDV